MLLFYKISTSTYFTAIKAASLFNDKAKKMITGRKGWRETLKKAVKKDHNYIWFHCASLGEFEQGRPLIEKLKQEKNAKIILTFFSPSGYEIRKNYEHADIVCYLPFDTKKNARDFIEIINPEYAVFVKYEFWYYMLKELEQKNIPSFLISGIFRKDQIFFKKAGRSYLECIKSFDYLFLQNKESENILHSNGITNTLVCGDTRTDRVVQVAREEYSNKFLETFCNGKKTLVCGSTWPEDEKIICKYINDSKDVKFIIAPHETDDKHIRKIESQISKPFCRYSLSEQHSPKDCDVVIIDSIGLLSKLYRYANIAYIGGGFGKGIHNVLEAAVYNIPVVFGPNYKNFKEAVDLINNGASFCVENQDHFNNIINKAIDIEYFAKKAGFSANKYISRSFGATTQIFDKMQQIVRKHSF